MTFKFHYRAEAQEMAARFQLDPDLVIAVCLVESSGKTSAYRHEPQFWLRYMANNSQWSTSIPERVSSSYGLMQVMYPVAREHGMPESDPPEFLFVPTYGLLYGCRKLREVLGWAKGDVAAALAAYNGGKTGDNKPGVFPKRNQAYVNKVLAMLEQVRGASF